MADISIKKPVLDWAVARAGFDFDEIIQKTRGKERKMKMADGIISVPLAKRLALKAKIPFGFLMLPEPPEINRPDVPDLRTFKYGKRTLSDSFYEQFEDIRNKVEWFSSEVADESDGPEYLGKFYDAYASGRCCINPV